MEEAESLSFVSVEVEQLGTGVIEAEPLALDGYPLVHPISVTHLQIFISSLAYININIIYFGFEEPGYI